MVDVSQGLKYASVEVVVAAVVTIALVKQKEELWQCHWRSEEEKMVLVLVNVADWQQQFQQDEYDRFINSSVGCDDNGGLVAIIILTAVAVAVVVLVIVLVELETAAAWFLPPLLWGQSTFYGG